MIRDKYREDKALLMDDSQWPPNTSMRDRAMLLMKSRGIDLAAFGVKT